MKMSTQVDLFTNVEPTSVSPAIAKPFVSRSTFYQGDCLIEMDKIADKSVDMILCDLPYDITDCKWDELISFEKLWKHYERIIKVDGVIALSSSHPFTNVLINSNNEKFRYCWYWIKSAPRGFANARKQPLRAVEEICIFYYKQPTYNPILIKKEEKNIRNSKYVLDNKNSKVYVGGLNKKQREYNEGRLIPTDMTYPRNTLYFDTVGNNNKNRFHSSQKPVELMEYLIKTYTNEGETVLDNCMGSGTTGVACKKTGRHFIGIEKDEKYFEIAVSRVSAYCG